ncbi:MAG TPA: hypothetical protein VNR17_10195 [Luteimicrobium sp.]|nr:hypothetical protein [Luteimicrobium sp.]
MFDYRRPLNEDRPRRIPTRPQGNIPVIARLLFHEREELVPARAIRWAEGRVLVLWLADGQDPKSELLFWLRAEDVYRTIPRRVR